MRKLIAFALSQRLLAAVLALALIGLGINAFLNLPVDAFPDISPTQAKIILKNMLSTSSIYTIDVHHGRYSAAAVPQIS